MNPYINYHHPFFFPRLTVDAKDKLVEAGCHIDCVASGEKPIEQAQTIRYDLIFIDIGLPGHLDGHEASKEIHA